MDPRTKKRLSTAKGVSVHRDKLRIAFTLPGDTKQTKRSLGIMPTVKNIDLAEMKLAEIKLAILRGTFKWEDHFPNDKQVRNENPTLADAMVELHLKQGSWKNSTRRQHESYVRTLDRLFPRAQLSDLTEPKLTAFQRQVSEQYSHNRAVALVGIMRNVMAKAVRAKLVLNNPFLYIEPLSKKNSNVGAEEVDDEPMRVFTIEEAENIIDAYTEQVTQNLLSFLFWSGVRPGEASALRWTDVNATEGTVTIRRTRTMKQGELQTPKTHAARTLILPARAMEALEAQRPYTSKQEYVFCRGDNHEPFANAKVLGRKRWKTILSKLGIPYLKPYTTRHSFASWALMAGESESYVAQFLGHANVDMVRRHYGHIIPKVTHFWTLDDPQNYNELKKSMRSKG